MEIWNFADQLAH